VGARGRGYVVGALGTEPTPAPSEFRGQVLDVARFLLTEGRSEELLELLAKLVARNSELERLLAQVRSGGKSKEGVSSEQLRLLLDGLAESTPALAEADQKLRDASGIDVSVRDEPSKPQRQPSLRKPLPPHLRRVDNPLTVPDAERACPGCGAMRTCIGHEVTEVLELVPAEAIVRVDRREKLACATCEGELVRAPAGDKVVSGGRMGTALVGQILVDKYWDGLPLHRQKDRFERLGVKLPVSTLADQVTWATDLLRPLWRGARAMVLASGVMHLDGTSLPVLDQATPGGIRLGSLWGYVGDDAGQLTALYLYNSTGKKQGQREGELGPEDMLSLRNGYTVADASGLFDASFQREGLIECGCNMHSRRYFAKALDAGDARAALPLAAFKKLYDIEEEIRSHDATAKLQVRRQKSQPVYDELAAWCQAHRRAEPPSSALGKAIGYLLNHEIALRRYLGDRRIPIDNGVVERLHVRAALTRKNFLFAGSDAGGERAAIAYTVLGCCDLADVNPVEYLADMLPRLARGVRLAEVPALLPAGWKAARASPASGA